MPKLLSLLILASILIGCNRSTHDGVSFSITEVDTNTNSSIRGMCIDSNATVWFSGSNGRVLNIQGGGLNDVSPDGLEALDFRSICTNDGSNIYALSAGSPAIIIKTENKGKSWRMVYSDSSETVFYNVMDFWNENEGVVFGDPEQGKFRILRTFDGGETWAKWDTANCPDAYDGEAGFAASGTNMRVVGKSSLYYLTGGSHSRLLISHNKGLSWSSQKLPLRQGKPSEGGYSFDINDIGHIAVVGGNYTEPNTSLDNYCYLDKVSSWKTSISPPLGYKSCVHFVNDSTLMAVGIAGMDFSNDYGQTWESQDTNYNLNVIQFVNDTLGYAAGKGVILKVSTNLTLP